jgi:hydroxymethylpyrimidine pyrophosphatase-like HAD family hydrolase
MRYMALASDYDDTLAEDGRVEEETIRALNRLKRSGRKLILVTGRELTDLKSVFPRLDVCDRVVAENGALLYDAASGRNRVLAERPPDHFLARLRHGGVTNVFVGQVIIATSGTHEPQVRQAIRDSGLDLHIIFNKGGLMILPSGVDKMTGLCSALDELRLSRHNVVGIGDAENDEALLKACECSVAVANAIPALRETAMFVTKAARGAGVVELIDKLIESDLSELNLRK